MGFTPLVKLAVQRYRIFFAAIIFCLRLRFLLHRVASSSRSTVRRIFSVVSFFLEWRACVCCVQRDNRYIVEFLSYAIRLNYLSEESFVQEIWN